MKIAIEATLAQGPATGLGVYVRNLVHELARQAPEHEFILLHASRRWHGPDFGPNCRPVSYWCGKQSLAIRIRLNAVLRREKADLFHVTCTTGAPPACAVPVITTVHDLYPCIEPQACGPTFRFFFRHLWGWTLRSSRHFITNSSFTAAELRRLTGVASDRITAIPLAPEPPLPPAEHQEVPGIAPGFFLCLGAVEPRKGQLRLAAAYAEACRQQPDLPELIFAGPDRGNGTALATLLRTPPLAGKARWLGTVATPAREWLYANAVAFLFPSAYEGFGIPVLEAMQRGLPVLAADIPPLREIAGTAAMLAPPADAEAWSNAMLRLADEPEIRSRFRTAGVERAATFSWGKTAGETLDCYRLVTADPRRSA